MKALSAADVVVHDGLVSDEILELAPATQGAPHLGGQAQVAAFLRPGARSTACWSPSPCEGLTVVRLKGGDPFIFGRGGEELEACREAGVECRIMPGVTAALAASADAGAPLTHRGAAQAVTFVTGHAASGSEPDLDWASLAKPNHTVVIYMGVSTAAGIAGRLMGAGRDRLDAGPGGRERQPRRRAPHRHHAGLGWPRPRPSVAGPALLIVGEAMALAQAGWGLDRQ